MERIPLPKLEPDVQNVFNKITDGALANVLDLDDILTSAPTTSGGEVKDNQIALYSDKLYLTISGTTYSINLTAV